MTRGQRIAMYNILQYITKDDVRTLLLRAGYSHASTERQLEETYQAFQAAQRSFTGD